MIGLCLSGGGSRAMAFHLGCLRALHDLDILQKINILSSVSGGSVIGAYYAYTPEKSFEEFESDVRRLLRTGFQRSIVTKLLMPQNLFPSISSFILTQVHDGLNKLGWELPLFHRYPSRTDVLHKVLEGKMFSGLALDSPRRQDLKIVIGASEGRTGSAFRFSDDMSGSWRLGKLVEKVNLSFAVTASAAYPILLPALDRTFTFQKGDIQSQNRILLTDGGVYDNLGIQVLEPGRDPSVSLHVHPCDYLIVCNAGPGQESGKSIPLGFFRRVAKTLSTLHRRVQDSSMHRLHHLREAGLIKGFAMPYLGQQDNRLPWQTANFITRDQVVNYPTNFAAMSNEWIERISTRGEQLTQILISYYLPELL